MPEDKKPIRISVSWTGCNFEPMEKAVERWVSDPPMAEGDTVFCNSSGISRGPLKACPLCGLTEDRSAKEDCKPWDILTRELPESDADGLIVEIKLKD